MTLLLYILFFSASIWKWHTLFVYPSYGIEENIFSQEKLYYDIFH